MELHAHAIIEENDKDYYLSWDLKNHCKNELNLLNWERIEQISQEITREKTLFLTAIRVLYAVNMQQAVKVRDGKQYN